jgi:hypothetical protein
VKKILTLNFLRSMALGVVVAGAICALGLTLHAGRNNKSVLLVVLFAGWVLSPFVALLVANAISARWHVVRRVTLYILMIVLTLGSLVGCSGALSPPGAKPAAVFLIVPFLSWFFIVTVIPIAAFVSRKLSDKGDGA